MQNNLYNRPDYVQTYLDNLKIPYFIIDTEILKFCDFNDNPDWEPKMVDFFDKLFSIDLKISFNQPLVIYHREYLTVKTLEHLHYYLRNQSANIENIVFVTSGGIGLKRYYENYCRLHSTRGFNVIEVPFMYWYEKFISADTEINLSQLPKKENIQSLFSYYGGKHEMIPPERSIMTLFASRYADIAQVETMTSPAEWQKIENFLEYLTYFCEVDLVDKYKLAYEKSVHDGSFIIPKLIKTDSPTIYEPFDRQGPMWQVNSRSFFSLLRETSCVENFYNLSEKTMRCFFHGLAIIPMHGRDIIEDLEDMGYIINRNFIDYSYLKEDNLIYRLKALETQLDSIRQNLNFDDLYQMWIDNYDQFSYNCNYLLKNHKTQTILPRLDNYFK